MTAYRGTINIKQLSLRNKVLNLEHIVLYFKLFYVYDVEVFLQNMLISMSTDINTPAPAHQDTNPYDEIDDTAGTYINVP